MSFFMFQESAEDVTFHLVVMSSLLTHYSFSVFFFCLFLMTLKILRHTGHVYYRLSLLWICLMFSS